MAAPRTYTTEAIILRQSKLGEADKLLTLYTQDHGKVRAIAKSVRRPGSKRSGHLDLLTHIRVMLARRRRPDLDLVTQAQTAESFLPLREDLARLSCGFYVAELVDCFTEERMDNPAVFHLTVDTLRHLCDPGDPATALRYFELHLVHHLGYRPELQQCVVCRGGLMPVTNFFQPASGGVLCADCSYDKPGIRPLSLNALKVLRLWQDSDFASASRVRVSRDLGLELEMLMRSYIRFLLDRDLKCPAWLDRLRLEQLCPPNGSAGS